MGIIHLLASSFHFFPSCSGQDRNKIVCEKSPLIWLTGVQSSQNQPKISCGGWGKSRNLVTKLCHSSLVFLWVGFSISEISTGHTALGQQEKELQTDPKSSKSQPKVDFREAPRSLQVLPPTDISKCTEMLNLEFRTTSFMLCKAQRSINSVYFGHEGWRFQQQLLWK